MALNIRFYLFLTLTTILCSGTAKSTEIIEPEREVLDSTTIAAQDLYLIHAIKYDVGILTETNDTAETNTQKNQKVQLSFYNANKNDSSIDLGEIPLPVQTNVSGQVINAIAPVNLGSVDLASFSNTGNGTNSRTIDASVGFVPQMQSFFDQSNVTQPPINASMTQVTIPSLLSFGTNSTLKETPLPILSYSKLNVSTTPVMAEN